MGGKIAALCNSAALKLGVSQTRGTILENYILGMINVKIFIPNGVTAIS